MIRRTRQRLAALPGPLAALAMFALVLSLLIPSGYMPATSGQGLVICTGHGAYTVDASGPGAPAKGKPAPVCAFAGLSTPLQSATPAMQPPLRVAFALVPDAAVADQVAGEVLAAPPPPAIGPPRST